MTAPFQLRPTSSPFAGCTWWGRHPFWLWPNLARRLLWEQEIAGSNPASQTQEVFLQGENAMAHEIFRWFMVGWLLLSIILAITVVEKPRKPLTAIQAAFITGINLTMIAGFIWLL